MSHTTPQLSAADSSAMLALVARLTSAETFEEYADIALHGFTRSDSVN